jgi:predicted aspartyl protease
LFKKTPPKKIKLKLTKTRHLVCQSRINGVKAVLLIDTGASNSCIALAEKDNFKIAENGEPFEASGAGKDKVKAILGHQCDLILGRHAVGKHAFILLDMQHINATLMQENGKPINGILGADFLKENQAVIDYKNKSLNL